MNKQQQQKNMNYINNTNYSDIFKKHCPFKIIGLDSNCKDIQTITKQYKLMLIKYHPDKGGDIKKYHLISNAYNEILLRLELHENSQKTFQTLKNEFKTQSKIEEQDQNYNININKEKIYTKGKFNNQAFNSFFENNQYKDPNENNGYTEEDFKNYDPNKKFQLKTYDDIRELNSASSSCFNNSYNYSIQSDYTQSKPFLNNNNSLNLTDYKYAFTDGCYLLETNENYEDIYNKYYTNNKSLNDYKNSRENIKTLNENELENRMNILQQRTNEEISRYEKWLEIQNKKETYNNRLQFN